MSMKKIVVVAVIAAAIAAWFYFGLGNYLQLDTLKQSMGELRAWYADNPMLAGLLYFAFTWR